MLSLSVGLGRYDRTQALLDGRVQPSGFAITVSSPPLEEIFARSFDKQEFDVSELSFSNFLALTASGKCAYAALPIFPSRMFRHSAIYVRSDRAIHSPKDLIGRIIGVREYSNTATLTVKGILADEYGIRASDIHWRYGAVDVTDTPPKTRKLPTGVHIEPIPSASNLSDMLLAGELDGIISYKPPKCFLEKHPSVERLFANHREVEEAYFRKTGIFPIMHLVGIRKDILGSVGPALCAAFEEAKRSALKDLESYQALAVSLPWAPAEYSRTKEILGDDPWPSGLKANRNAIEASMRWSFEQGLLERKLEISELFAPDLLDWEPSR
jgi:4,5-dihydroxyphthalate decarboxylase